MPLTSHPPAPDDDNTAPREGNATERAAHADIQLSYSDDSAATQFKCYSLAASAENRSATEQATDPTKCRHDKMIGHAAEQPAADRAATRYLVTVYSLNPARRPDAHTVVCIMLYKGLLSDDSLRAFIEEHINTANPPVLTLGSDEAMQTMNFVTHSPAQPLPALCQQLRDYCSRPQATRFQESLLDGAGYTIGLLSLTPDEWQHTCDVRDRLAAAVRQRAALLQSRPQAATTRR